MIIPHHRYLLILSFLFFIEWIVLAIDPYYRDDWMLENVLVVVFAVLLASSYQHLPLSRVSYTFIFIFLCLHEIGSHYTYAEVPYDQWFMSLTGGTLNEMLGWERNNFDRAIHFCYGLFLAYPAREIFLRLLNVRGFWSYFLPLTFIMSTSLLYELIEWGAAMVFGGDLGMAYLGIQGDVWDGHKDMALASLGAFLAMNIMGLLNFYLQRDFAAEWSKGLRVKNPKPLQKGEVTGS
jgi:putative membrane protein